MLANSTARRGTRATDNPPPYETQRRYSPNILVVGETGVGKSSVINLVAGEELAAVHSGVCQYTLDAHAYDLILPDDQGVPHHLRLFDTVGLNEPQFGRNDYLTAIKKANTFICQLQRMGGIRLLLFCIRGDRVTAVMQNNYRLFCEILCQNEVPVALVITGLENEVSMEGWWDHNAYLFDAYRLSCVSHACITATRGLNNCFAERYYESQARMRDMLLGFVTGSSASWKPEREVSFIRLAGELLRWISQTMGQRRHQHWSLTVEELARHLQVKCNFPRSEAIYLSGKIWAKWQDNADSCEFVQSDDVSSMIRSTHCNRSTN